MSPLSVGRRSRVLADRFKVNVTQTFTTVYDKNTTGPTFYYCKVGQHCANGMFGIIKSVPTYLILHPQYMFADLISPPSSNVTNELTDKATAPRPDSTAGAGGKTAPGVDGWITSWGVTVSPPPVPSSFRTAVLTSDVEPRQSEEGGCCQGCLQELPWSLGLGIKMGMGLDALYLSDKGDYSRKHPVRSPHSPGARLHRPSLISTDTPD